MIIPESAVPKIKAVMCITNPNPVNVSFFLSYPYKNRIRPEIHKTLIQAHFVRQSDGFIPFRTVHCESTSNTAFGGMGVRASLDFNAIDADKGQHTGNTSRFLQYSLIVYQINTFLLHYYYNFVFHLWAPLIVEGFLLLCKEGYCHAISYVF